MEKGNEIKIVVPPLRFPEFQGINGWEEKKLEEIGNFIGGGTPNTAIQEYWDGGIPWYTPTEIKNGDLKSSNRTITEKGLKNSSAKLLPQGAILITTRATIGDVAISKKECTTNQGFQSLVVNDSESNLFWFYWIIRHKEELIKRASGSTFKEISKNEIINITSYSPKKQEQQKIANCLSSLDNLIEATAQKVETLKEHKKGLMQRLFPAEGKNVPDLRFPEFFINATWDIVSFAKYIKLFRGSSPRPIKEYLTDAADGINWIKIGDTQYAKGFVLSEVQEKITKRGAEKSRYVHKGELVLANSMSFGKTYLLAIDGCIYDGWFVLRGYEEAYYKPFLLQILNSDYVQNQYKRLSAGGIVLNISSEIVYQIHIFHTSIQEQKKIADCLSSLDELIEATSRKVEILRDHKKGLMQQLFP